jgi:hypothetical protein
MVVGSSDKFENSGLVFQMHFQPLSWFGKTDNWRLSSHCPFCFAILCKVSLGFQRKIFVTHNNMMVREAVFLPECLAEFPKIWMCKNPSIVISSILSYICNCKFITIVYPCQQNNRKTVFVIEKLGTAIWRGLNLHVFSFQLGQFHRSQKSFTICDQVVWVGVGITSCIKCFIMDLNASW